MVKIYFCCRFRNVISQPWDTEAIFCIHSWFRMCAYMHK